MNPHEEPGESALESCRAAESRIREAQRFLLTARKDDIERSMDELSQIAAILESLISGGPASLSPAMAPSLQRIQRTARDLLLQIGHATNLWQGWLQRKLGAGYTERGQPVFVECNRAGSYEA